MNLRDPGSFGIELKHSPPEGAKRFPNFVQALTRTDPPPGRQDDRRYLLSAKAAVDEHYGPAIGSFGSE